MICETSPCIFATKLHLMKIHDFLNQFLPLVISNFIVFTIVWIDPIVAVTVLLDMDSTLEKRPNETLDKKSIYNQQSTCCGGWFITD